MRLERVGQASFRLTLHGYELASLMAAARLAVEEGGPSMPPDAVEQLRRTLASYEEATQRADSG